MWKNIRLSVDAAFEGQGEITRFAPPDLPGEQLLVVGEVVTEERERVDTGTASEDDLRPAIGDGVHPSNWSISPTSGCRSSMSRSYPKRGGTFMSTPSDWSRTVSRADGYIFVSPEYNHGLNAATKNALDYLYHEWRDKPAGFVSYGGRSAGTRAVQMLKQVVSS
jgi:hypothetical protein